MHKAGSAAMQSLLQAVGVGAKNSLPAAAGINWVLKDGLGRLGRLSVSTRFGTSFDSNLKVLPAPSHYLVVPCTPSIPNSEMLLVPSYYLMVPCKCMQAQPCRHVASGTIVLRLHGTHTSMCDCSCVGPRCKAGSVVCILSCATSCR